MNQTNFMQLILLVRNSPDTKISKLMDRKNFFLFFLEHVSQHFSQLDRQFRILEPLLDPTFEEDKSTIMAIDDVEVGEINLIYNSGFNSSSLIYFSPSRLIESLVFEYRDFDQFKVSDYVLLIYEFAAMLIGNEILYSNEK